MGPFFESCFWVADFYKKTSQNQVVMRGFWSTEGRYKTHIPKEIKRNKTQEYQQIRYYRFSLNFTFFPFFYHFLRPICTL